MCWTEFIKREKKLRKREIRMVEFDWAIWDSFESYSIYI